MATNFARLLWDYEGQSLVLEWSDGLCLRVVTDTFEEAADNEDGLDSIIVRVEEVIRERPPSVQAGKWLELKENEPLARISTPSGEVIWSAQK